MATHAFLFVLLGLIVSIAPTRQQCSQSVSQASGVTWSNIYSYTCPTTQSGIPTIPTTYNGQSLLGTINVLSLSPNVFASIPYSQICAFTKVYKLIMSYNQLTSLTGAFSSLASSSCLSALTAFDFSNNQISSPIVYSDFSDTTAAQFVSMNFSNNLIPYINTNVFFKSDGRTTRFPNLVYLGLANNRLMALDLLWPLSLPQASLTIEMQNNQYLTSLVNQLSLSYVDSRFSYAMTGQRTLNLQTNSLQYLDDTNLVQYGLYSSTDFQTFLNKILNYDFRQSSGVQVFFCICQNSIQVLTWYKQISAAFASTDYPIFKLYCKTNQFSGSVYIFNFPATCNATSSNTSTSATTTGSGVTATTTTGSSNTASIDFQFGDSGSSSSSSSSSNNNLLFLLFLLIIPILLILLVLFICCLGRVCQSCLYSCCAFVCCPCFRPADKSKYTDKYYDATICFSREDKYWVEQFISEITLPKNNYRLHKQCLGSSRTANGSQEPVSKENEKILRRSRRIILIFTGEFCDSQFNNKHFLEILRDIYRNDPNCVIIAINKDFDRDVVKDQLRTKIEAPNLYSVRDPDQKPYKRSCFTSLKQQIVHQLGLNNIEIIDYNDKRFYSKFRYVMPIRCYDETKPALITRTPSTKKTTSSLEYVRDVHQSTNLRHIIVPIPEFMRTKLGFTNKKVAGNSTVASRNNLTENTEYSEETETRQLSLQINTPKQAKFANADIQQQDINISTISHTQHHYVQQPQYSMNLPVMIGGGPKTAQPTYSGSNGNVRGNLVINNKITTSNQHSYSRNRSETPEILAMFAPNPNTVVQIDSKQQEIYPPSTEVKVRSSSKQRRSSHRANSIDYPAPPDYPPNNYDI